MAWTTSTLLGPPTGSRLRAAAGQAGRGSGLAGLGVGGASRREGGRARGRAHLAHAERRRVGPRRRPRRPRDRGARAPAGGREGGRAALGKSRGREREGSSVWWRGLEDGWVVRTRQQVRDAAAARACPCCLPRAPCGIPHAPASPENPHAPASPPPKSCLPPKPAATHPKRAEDAAHECPAGRNCCRLLNLSALIPPWQLTAPLMHRESVPRTEGCCTPSAAIAAMCAAGSS